MKSILLPVVSVLALALGAYALLGPRGSDAAPDQFRAPPSLISVQVGTLKRLTVHRYVTGYGVVEPAPATAQHPAAAAAVAAAVTGVVTRVSVVAGENVRRGQLLMDLNSDAMAEAYAAQEAARQRKLYATHNTSLKALEHAEAQLGLLRVTAPLSGTVVRVNVVPGSPVGSKTVLVEIMDLRRLVVRTDIPQPQAGELKVGETLQILGAAPVTTRLGYISSTVNQSDGAVTTWAPLPSGRGLRPGEYLRVRIVTAVHSDALVAPTDSVVSNLAGQSDLSLVRGDEAIRMPVETGLREGGWIEVSGKGLEAGTTVVTVGAFGLPRRTRIRIVSELAERSGAVASGPPAGP